MIAFIGVRISWLIVARKVLFASFAASAAARASCAAAYSRALSSAIDASWAKRCSSSTSEGSYERPSRAAPGDAKRTDHSLPVSERNRPRAP